MNIKPQPTMRCLFTFVSHFSQFAQLFVFKLFRELQLASPFISAFTHCLNFPQQLTFPHDPTESPQQRNAAGEVAERPIAPVLKTGVPVRVPRVRIPASPLVEFPIAATICNADGCGDLVFLSQSTGTNEGIDHMLSSCRYR